MNFKQSSYLNIDKISLKQKGFTLVELMIAGTLGIILIGGMIQIFIGSSQTFKIQRAISEVLDKGRTATIFISREIENAGFGGDGLVAGAFGTLPNNVAFSGGQINGGLGTINGQNVIPKTVNNTGPGNNDILHILSTGNFDCVGAATVAPAFLVENIFDVVNKELRCNNQPLINGVESFHLLYGVDSDGDRFVDQYMTATRVAATGNETNVLSVKISMIVATQQEKVFSQAVSQSYKVLDESTWTPPLAERRRLRRKFSTTVMLVNRP